MRPLALALCLACTGWGQAQPPPAAEAAARQAAAYVGSEVCPTCHEDIFNAIQKSAHAVVGTDKKRGWDGKTCEACHGPGSKHAEGGAAEEIRNPAKLGAPEVDRTCLTCHLNQPTHVGRIQSSHAK